MVTGDYELSGKFRGASTAKRTIGGAAVGSIIGAIAGGGEGAAIGGRRCWRRRWVGNHHEGKPGESAERDSTRIHAAAECFDTDTPDPSLANDCRTKGRCI